MVLYTSKAFPLSPVISQENAFCLVSTWRSQVNKSTHYAKKGEVQRNWVLIDADGRQQMIYKHAISTVAPARPVSLELQG